MNIFSVLSGAGSGLTQILMQAVGAYLRGDTPQDFLKKLARTRPELNGLDLDDLEGTANRLAKENGTTVDQVAATVKQKVGGML